MRSANLSLLLRDLADHGPSTRANLAQRTGLSKAAVTSLVTDLSERGLVREGPTQRQGSVGRPGTALHLDPTRVAGIGMDLAADQLTVCLQDLGGGVRFTTARPTPFIAGGERGRDAAAQGADGQPSADAEPARTYPAATVLDLAAQLICEALQVAEAAGLWVAGVGVAAPGPIDEQSATVRFASNLGWQQVPLAAELDQRLMGEELPVAVQNDAKLSALAAAPRLARRGVADLIYLTGDVGVGAGIIVGGNLLRGFSGSSGEVGHISLGAPTPTAPLRACRCGRRGCWETLVGLEAVLDLLPAEDPGRTADWSVARRLARLRELAAAREPAVTEGMAQLTTDLARGLGVLTDVLNPQVVILGGAFGELAELLVSPVQKALDARLLDPAGRVEVLGSWLGLQAAARGGATLALQRVLEDPLRVPVLSPPASSARPGPDPAAAG